MYVHDPNATPAALARPPYLSPETPRSSIPKVIGVLAIVFACLGAFGALGALGMAISAEDEMRKFGLAAEELGAFGTWIYAYVLLSVALFAVHLAAGIQSVRYAASAPRWMTIYGVLAIALVVTDLIVSFAAIPRGDGHGREALYQNLFMPRLSLAILGMPWPIIALVMMNLRSARLACSTHRT